MSQLERPVFDILAAKAKLRGKKMSMATLAARIGLTRQAVGHWFRGRGEPDVRQLKAMARELGCHWLELVTEDATVIYQKAEIERTERIRGMNEQTLAELDDFIAFKASQQK